MVFSNYKQGKEEKLTKNRKRIRNITTITTTTTSIEDKALHLDLPYHKIIIIGRISKRWIWLEISIVSKKNYWITLLTV
jgi:hypothetical protein